MQLAKKALALPGTEVDSIFFIDPRRQRLAVPQIRTHPAPRRSIAQGTAHSGQLLCREARWPTRMLSFPKAIYTSLLEAAYPILHRARGIAQQLRHLRTGHAVRN